MSCKNSWRQGEEQKSKHAFQKETNCHIKRQEENVQMRGKE
jgi:hypothetical protein